MITNVYQVNFFLLTTYFVFAQKIPINIFDPEMKVNIPNMNPQMKDLVINEGDPLEITCIQNIEFDFVFCQNNECNVSNFPKFFQLLLDIQCSLTGLKYISNSYIIIFTMCKIHIYT